MDTNNQNYHYGHQPNPTYPRESVESVESDAVSEEDTLESNQMVFIKGKRKCCEWGI